jgi:hypothetical protein
MQLALLYLIFVKLMSQQAANLLDFYLFLIILSFRILIDIKPELEFQSFSIFHDLICCQIQLEIPSSIILNYVEKFHKVCHLYPVSFQKNCYNHLLKSLNVVNLEYPIAKDA